MMDFISHKLIINCWYANKQGRQSLILRYDRKRDPIHRILGGQPAAGKEMAISVDGGHTNRTAFSLPIIIIVFTGRYWYVRADMEVNASLSPVLLIICVVLIAIFVAIFYKRHQWDMKEQQYKELKAKEQREQKEAASGTDPVQH